MQAFTWWVALFLAIVEAANLYAEPSKIGNTFFSQKPLLIADYYLEHHNPLEALSIIKQALRNDPNNIELWDKKGQIEFQLYWYPQAAESYQTALKFNPQDTTATDQLNEIKGITPYYTHGINEIGLNTDNQYVNDLHAVWDYTSAFYGRDTDYGRILGKINFASRLEHAGAQYELNYSPRLSRNVYFDLLTAYSNEPLLFPTYTYGAEGFLNWPEWFEISLGARHHNIVSSQSSTYFSRYTGSIDRYVGNYWFSLRVFYFVPKDHQNSTLYSATARKYFSTIDHFLGITAGTGHSPDLSDLETVNFLVIKNNFVNLNYQFPIWNHLLILDINTSYQRWVYPNELVRNLYGANIGSKYRF
jgi:YaiO family outer membrane protein